MPGGHSEFGVVGASCGLIFFFQAEDGIRDKLVTGVQTCALPIWPALPHVQVALRQCEKLAKRAGMFHDAEHGALRAMPAEAPAAPVAAAATQIDLARSEERRVGKECSTRC